MKKRYSLNLAEQMSWETGLNVSDLREADTQALANLMLDAYRNTIDWEDETLQDAVDEINGFLAGQALLNESLVLSDEQGYQCACLVTYLEKQEAPLIAYIMTAARAKKTGLAHRLLQEVLYRLQVAGYARVLAAITDGNVPSETLFSNFNFQEIKS